MTLANYLYTLVYSNVYNEKKWQVWGENILVNAVFDENTEWIFDVVLANDKDEVFNVISDRMNNENYLYYNKYTLTEIIQGYYYYQYKCNQMDLNELLDKSGSVADAADDSMGCEFFYDLLNKLEKTPQIVNSVEFIEVISNYYKPLYCVAMEQKNKLESATIDDLYLR